MLVSANIFQPLIDVFQHVITFFHDSLGLSWGWAIVLLTVCVRLILMPLTVKQFQSMRRLQAHQPEMKAIQQKYKDDKQLQQQEMMKFYQENNVNPFASCLPMALQFPVFIALFYMLRKNLREDICPDTQAVARAHYAAQHGLTAAQAASHTVACGHVPEASFLFLKDITDTATGVSLIVLLVLYVGTQMASTLLMAQPGMDKNQQRMMLILPLVFVLFVIKFPAGLMVYWVTTNLWTMGQQLVLRRWMGPPPPAATAGDKVVVLGGVATPVKSGSGRAGGAEKSTGGGGSGERGGLTSRLLGRAEAKGSAGSATGTGKAHGGAAPAAKGGGAVPPPPPPRKKKKKRSGRRR